MDNALVTTLWENYNIVAALVALASIIVLTKIGKWLVFKVPALHDAREANRAEDKVKWKTEKYKPVVRATQKTGLTLNIVFFLLLLPFCITFEPHVWWKVLLDMAVILMVYDFFYYLAHRFWFHGNGPMRKIHALHHQARNPTYLDAHYVHHLETFVGLGGFLVCIAALTALMGPFQVSTIIITYMVYVELNQINHTQVALPYFPFKTLSWITAKHHVHHENMHKGNYATITPLYDKLFGTLD